ncbi:hypothetical protein FD754_000784 [Muntiacus muntjak]|uniref:NADH dehydrogenase [ubiquinone] 1 beta subcomplex subunit 7 n=1 Tax=Muntiacus muntjak TaxID=9888 RepID=A0A5N3W6M1_MUNMU|nr:hypothetical protein FD754_000784 [Muntiacus muntjak]
MGAHLAQRYLGDVSVEPDPLQMPTFPPDYGFPERKEREMLVLRQRDYCAHYLIRFLKCKRDNFPNFLACKHEQHDWDYCEHLDYRRLLRRKKRREQREADMAKGLGPGEVAPEVAL